MRDGEDKKRIAAADTTAIEMEDVHVRSKPLHRYYTASRNLCQEQCELRDRRIAVWRTKTD